MKRRNLLTMLGAGSALVTVAATRNDGLVAGQGQGQGRGRVAEASDGGQAEIFEAGDREGGTLAEWQARPRIPMLHSAAPADPRLRHVLQAVEKGQRLRFEYWGGSTPRADREVTPGLVFRLEENEEAPIYITGYCHRRRAERVFRWDRVVLRSV